MKDRIRKIRKDAGLTQAEFAETLGATRPMITSYEVGAVSPPMPMIELICCKYSVRRDWLLSGDGSPYEPCPSLGSRVRSVRESVGLSQTQFGRILGGASQAMITSYETGRVVPDGVMIALISRTFGVDERWLLHGTGTMHDRFSTVHYPIARLVSDAPHLQDFLRRAHETLTADDYRYIDGILARMYQEVTPDD